MTTSKTSQDERQIQATENLNAPAELAVETELTPQQVREVTEAINPLIADAFALYIKTKNFHWHLSGSHFRDYHLLFDRQAESILASIDRMADGVRNSGGTTIRSIGHIKQLQTIQDDTNDVVPAGQMVQELLNDNAHHAQMIRHAVKVCDECRKYSTSNILQELLDEAERRKWFLFEVLRGMHNTD